MKIRLVAIALMLVAFPTFAAAQSVGPIGYGGTGCPGGTASVSLSGNTLTVRFSSYRVAAGGSTGKTFDRKSCNLSIPVVVPAGRQVAIVGADYKGSASLPSGASGVFKAEYFLPGATGPVGEREIKGPFTKSFTLATPKVPLVWSACGTDPTLRTNSSLRVTTSGGKAAAISVRRQEVQTALSFRLQWRNC